MMSDGWYDMDGKRISAEEFARRYPGEKRRIGRTQVTADVDVSTVLLGLDHQYNDGPPIIFETMVFRAGSGDTTTERYATKEEAQAGHQRIVFETAKSELARLTAALPTTPNRAAIHRDLEGLASLLSNLYAEGVNGVDVVLVDLDRAFEAVSP